MADKKFWAGAATSNISPALGVSLNGSMRDRTAQYIHDELHARCLVLDDGQTRLAMVVCDSCMIPGELHEAAKHRTHEETGIPMDRIVISATHTHTAPTVAGVFQSEPDEEYAEFLVLRIADGVRRAQYNLTPAKIGWGVGSEPTQVFNRRWYMKPGAIGPDPFGTQRDRVKMNPPRGSDQLLEPAGPTDPEVPVLAVVSGDGRPIALWSNYSLHYVGGTGSGHVSADYFGMFAQDVARGLKADYLDPPFVAAMTNGTSGDINNIDFRRASPRQPPYAQMRKVAHLVGVQARKVFKDMTFHDWVPLDMREARLTLGRRLPKPAEVKRARDILARAQGPQLRTLEEIYARETVLISQWPSTKETVVQAIRIGDLGIATSPCETFVETGLAIKANSPLKPTFTIELANDYAGYLPTVEQHRLGGYETWRARSSYLEVEAEPKIRGKILELLHELA